MFKPRVEYANIPRNMRGDYKKYLLWKPTTTLQQLVDAGRQIDASNFSLYNKMFGSEKSPNVVNEIKSSKPDSKSPPKGPGVNGNRGIPFE